MVVVNLFGAPGAGKSTGAAYVFAKLKMLDVNVELVTEFAKDKVWEESKETFNNQAYIFGRQYFRISRLENKVDVVVTDSPLLLSSYYNHSPVLGASFDTLVLDVFNSYDNKNYLITRQKEYNPKGRFQTREESDCVAREMVDFVESRNLEYKFINGEQAGYDIIVDEIYEALTRSSD